MRDGLGVEDRRRRDEDVGTSEEPVGQDSTRPLWNPGQVLSHQARHLAALERRVTRRQSMGASQVIELIERTSLPRRCEADLGHVPGHLAEARTQGEVETSEQGRRAKDAGGPGMVGEEARGGSGPDPIDPLATRPDSSEVSCELEYLWWAARVSIPAPWD